MLELLDKYGYMTFESKDISQFSNLENEIKNVNWVKDKSGCAAQIPDFLSDIWEFENQNHTWLEKEKIGLTEGLMQFYFPKAIIEGCENIWTSIFPNVAFVSAATLLWNGIHNVTQSWHWDGYDRDTYGDYFFMCYFNNYPYDSTCGGELEIAYTNNIINQYDVEYDTDINLKTIRKILPKHGIIIIIKTEFPFLVHRALPIINGNFNRYTLLNGIILK